jgi:CRP-like cAMP-binding protein
VPTLSGLKNLKKSEILFREGDASDAMYVIKSGKIAITKAKGTSEVILAELGPGDMLGEMAFFDNRPRSAGAKAMIDTVIIELPFKALNAQFKTFPEWLKAIVRTVNNHLRNANSKIKNLERSTEEETEYFPPHLVTRPLRRKKPRRHRCTFRNFAALYDPNFSAANGEDAKAPGAFAIRGVFENRRPWRGPY